MKPLVLKVPLSMVYKHVNAKYVNGQWDKEHTMEEGQNAKHAQTSLFYSRNEQPSHFQAYDHFLYSSNKNKLPSPVFFLGT